MKRNAMVLAAALLPLLAARAVTFTEDAHIPDGDATYEGEPVTVSGCTLTVDGAHVFTNLVLVNSAPLTHTPGSGGTDAMSETGGAPARFYRIKVEVP